MVKRRRISFTCHKVLIIFFRVRTALINGLKRREKLHGKRSSRNKDGVVDLSDMPIPPPKERVSLKHLTGEERIRHCTERRKEWMANMHPNRRRRMRERAKDRQAKFAERKNAAKITGCCVFYYVVVHLFKRYCLLYNVYLHFYVFLVLIRIEKTMR